MKKAELLFRISLAILDAAMITLAFRLAHALRLMTEYPPPVDPPPFSTYWVILMIQVVALLVVFFFYKLYHLKRGTSRVDEFYSVFAAVSVGTIIAMAVASLVFPKLSYPRLLIGYAWILTIVLVTIGRSLHDLLQRALRSQGIDSRRVVIVGAGDVGGMILDQIRKSPGLGYTPIGIVSNTLEAEEFAGFPALGRRKDLARILREQEVDEVIIALPEASHEEMLDIISSCEISNVSIKVFPDLFQIMASEVSIGDLSGLPLLSIRDASLRGWRLTLKRAVDLIVSAVALIVLSPFMLITALLIKLDSSGSTFYIQERVGLDGKPFQVIKFRSMQEGAEEATGPVWAKEADPRRTKIGSFIRRWSIDELPHTINVLLGQMRLVGPRPERPVFVEQFKEMVPRYMERHKEKAGLTGWAQVNGLRGDTSIVERTKYDLYYIENWSLWFDFKIMIKTIAIIFQSRNAY